MLFVIDEERGLAFSGAFEPDVVAVVSGNKFRCCINAAGGGVDKLSSVAVGLLAFSLGFARKPAIAQS